MFNEVFKEHAHGVSKYRLNCYLYFARYIQDIDITFMRIHLLDLLNTNYRKDNIRMGLLSKNNDGSSVGLT